MADSLTYEKVLELIAEANRRSNEDLDRRMEKSRKNFDDELEKNRKKFDDDLKKSRKEFDERIKKEAEEREKSRKEFDERMKKLDGKFGNVLGSFVEGLVEPKLLELF